MRHTVIVTMPAMLITTNSLEEVSKKKGASMAQIALAWSLAQDVITAPIVGTTSLNNLLDLLRLFFEHVLNIALTHPHVFRCHQHYAHARGAEILGRTLQGEECSWSQLNFILVGKEFV